MNACKPAILAAALAIGCGPSATTGGAVQDERPAGAKAGEPAVTPAPALVPARPKVELGSLWAVRRNASGRGVLSSEIGTLSGGELVGGFGTGGLGVGGGGTGIGVIGTGAPSPGMRGRRSVRPTVTIGRPRVAGGLDKNIIRRYIRRMLPRIRYCYERQLLVKQHLRGTVYVRFTIDPQGRVLNPVASGVDKAVSSCVAQVIRRLRFPKPPGGGLVHVTYPFQFRQGGSSSSGVTPLEPPPPPPPPKPQMQPIKPRPIDAPESPLVSKVTEPPPPPKGPLACHPAARPDGLEAILPAAEACYEHLLDREPEATGRLFVTLSIDESGVIADTVAQGIPDRHLATCVARAAKGLVLTGSEADALRGGKAIFSLYLNKDGGEQAATQTVTATDHDLRLGLRLIASEVAWNKVDAVQRAAWKRVAREATDDPLVLQIADEIDAGAVLAATVALGRRAHQVRYARELEGGGWKIVNPLGNGTFRGVCPGAPASRVSVLIDRDGIWVGTDKGRDHVPMADGEHDLLGYARLLRSLRRRELAGRSDLELAVTAGVPYGAFARALEIAIETGFHDAEVRPVGYIRNPRRQAARPR